MPITDPYSTDQYSPYTGSPVPVRTYEDRIFGRLTEPYPMMNYFQSQPYTYDPNQIAGSIYAAGGLPGGTVGTGSTGTAPTGTIPTGTPTGTTATGTQPTATGTQPTGTQQAWSQQTGTGFNAINPYSLINPAIGTAMNVATGNLNIGDINSVGGTLTSLGGSILGAAADNPALGGMIGFGSGLATDYLTNQGWFSPNALIGATAGESVVPGGGNLLSGLTEQLGNVLGYPLGTNSLLTDLTSVFGGGMNPASDLVGMSVSAAIMPDIPKIEGAGGYLQSIVGAVPIIGPIIAGMLGSLFEGDQVDPLAYEGAAKRNAIGTLQQAVLQKMNELAATPEGQALLNYYSQSGATTTPEGWMIPAEWRMPSHEQWQAYYDYTLGKGWETSGPPEGWQGMWADPSVSNEYFMPHPEDLQNNMTREEWWSTYVAPGSSPTAANTMSYNPETGQVTYSIPVGDPSEGGDIYTWLRGDISQDAYNLYQLLNMAPAISELQTFMFPWASGILGGQILSEGGGGIEGLTPPTLPVRPETLELAKLIFPTVAEQVEQMQANTIPYRGTGYSPGWTGGSSLTYATGVPTEYNGTPLDITPGEWTETMNPWSTYWQYPYASPSWDAINAYRQVYVPPPVIDYGI